MLSHVSRVCFGPQARSSPLAEAQDSFLPLISVARVAVLMLSWHGPWAGLFNLAMLQGSASQTQLMICTAAIPEWTGAASMKTITWSTRKWKQPLPAPFLHQEVDGLNAHLHQGPH